MAAKRKLSVIERRLQSGQVFATGSQPIPLQDPKRWTIREINTEVNSQRAYQMLAHKGWVYVEPADLAVKPEEIGFREQDGRIVRGTHGTLVLMKMERADYKAIQQEKDTQNRLNTFGQKALKNSIVSAIASEPDGDRGADFVNRNLSNISVTDSRESVPLED